MSVTQQIYPYSRTVHAYEHEHEYKYEHECVYDVSAALEVYPFKLPLAW